LLHQQVASLTDFPRPSASAGEQQAAQMISSYLTQVGFRSAVETERAHGEYWRPMMLATAGAAVAGLAARKLGRLAALPAAAAAAGIWDDITGGDHHIRRLLPSYETHNVVATLGPKDAQHTVVLVAHHDAARSGAIFNPAIPETINRLWPGATERKSSPPVMWPVFAGPALVAAGTALGLRRMRQAGMVLSAGAAAVFAEIGNRDVVDGANDNVSGVVCLLALAERLARNPTASVRVMLVSTGSEESFMEGMHGFAKRHFPQLDPQRTFVLCVDTVGSRRLCQLKAEGMLRLYRYPPAAIDLVARAAGDVGVDLDSDVVLRNATDGLYAVKAGYPSAMLGSYSDHGAPANYHWPSDTADQVNYDTLADAVRLCERVVRRLDQRWMF
jgi:hypothetical protein